MIIDSQGLLRPEFALRSCSSCLASAPNTFWLGMSKSVRSWLSPLETYFNRSDSCIGAPITWSALQLTKQFVAKGNEVHATARSQNAALSKMGNKVQIGHLDTSDPESIKVGFNFLFLLPDSSLESSCPVKLQIYWHLSSFNGFQIWFTGQKVVQQVMIWFTSFRISKNRIASETIKEEHRLDSFCTPSGCPETLIKVQAVSRALLRFFKGLDNFGARRGATLMTLRHALGVSVQLPLDSSSDFFGLGIWNAGHMRWDKSLPNDSFSYCRHGPRIWSQSLVRWTWWLLWLG